MLRFRALSYDLYFLATPRPEQEEFVAHFKMRPFYSIESPSQSQAAYANEDTGVYFSFDFSSAEEESEDDPDDPASDAWASFNINYYRPHYFADEAVPELEAFVARFNRRVFDPQRDGMGEGDFSAEVFRRGWNRVNEIAYRSMPSSGMPAPITRPASTLERIWRWNIERSRFQEQVGDAVFVPRISFFRSAERVFSASVWTDAIPAVLPETEMVIIYRDRLAAGLFRQAPTIALASWEHVASRLAGRRRDDTPLPHHYLDDAEPSTELVRWIKKLPVAPPLERVAMDQVLDAEIVNSGKTS